LLLPLQFFVILDLLQRTAVAKAKWQGLEWQEQEWAKTTVVETKKFLH
jgi:hypothetical protein